MAMDEKDNCAGMSSEEMASGAVSGKETARQKARQYSPLTLAFMGDSVYEREIREYVVREGNFPPNELNRRSSFLAKAATQAKMAHLLEASLTKEEADILRRGRNAHSATMAKNATVSDYRLATGLEALFGYLYLSGDEARAKELIAAGVAQVLEEKKTSGMK